MSFFSRIVSWGGANPNKPAVVLRSDLAHDPNLDAVQTLAAFSPDIVPLGTTKPERADIAGTYSHFVAHPLHASEKNNVWIRARAFGSNVTQRAAVSLLEVQNELILWPQVWVGEPSVGESVLKEEQGGPGNLLVGAEPIVVSGKTYESGRHSTLIALYDERNTRATAVASNWRQFVDLMSAHPTLTALNALTVTTVEEHAVLRTRLRIFENELEFVDLRLSLEAVGIPKAGLEAKVCVYSGTGEELYTIERTRLLPGSIAPGVDVRLPRDFDGMVHVEVYKEEWVLISDYASVSLVATATNSRGLTTLLGAEHIVYDSSVTLKEYLAVKAHEWDNPVFWFRNRLGDGAPPQKSGNGSSPDIQPAGMKPDPNATQTYSNWGTDVSGNNRVQLYPNASNYIYGRLETSQAVSALARMYAVPSGMLQYPSKYFKFEVKDSFMSDKYKFREDTAYRGFSSSGPGRVVVPLPFNHFKPPPSNSMSPGSDHYCLIIEAAQGVDISNPNAFTSWPHQDVLAVTSQFTAWMLNEPRVAYRNMSYATGANKDIIVKQTALTLPEVVTPNDQWQYYVDVTNAPIGSEVETVGQLIGRTQPVTNEDLSIDPGRIRRTTTQRFVSQVFTGVTHDFDVILTTYWRPNGQPRPNNLVIDAGIMTLSSNLNLIAQTQKRHAKDPELGTGLVVGKDYPLFKSSVKGLRTNLAQGYTGIRGAMHAYDAPGKIAAAAYAAQAPPIRAFVIGTDTEYYD